MRDENRRRFSRYFEIFLDAPLQVLEARDAKGLYASARKGKTRNVVGIDIPFERPIRSDMVIDSSGDTADVKRLAAEVLERVR
jgi:adenylylsulfate kinase